MSYFEHIAEIRYEGPQSDNPLAYRHYDRSKRVLGKTLEEHLRIAVCYWHTFVWPGVDIFGQGTFVRPWQQPGDAMERAHQKADAAFEFFSKLGTPYYTFHDTDVAPEGASIKEYSENFTRISDYLARKQQDTGVKLLWGTANLFSHPRYAGARRPARTRTCLRLRPPRYAMRSTPRNGSAERTTCCGAAAKATTRCSIPTWCASAISLRAFSTWWSSISTRSASRAHC
jgi:xylose isomerase